METVMWDIALCSLTGTD